MRNYEQLDKATFNAETGVLYLESAAATTGMGIVAMRKEGAYVAISASYGPLEIALRPRLHELSRVLGRLQPVEGFSTTRQIGTGQAFLSLGLRPDGFLIMRPTLVADAAGHITFNLLLTDPVRQKLFEWLPVDPNASTGEFPTVSS